jgi:hypothetical protein
MATTKLRAGREAVGWSSLVARWPDNPTMGGSPGQY